MHGIQRYVSNDLTHFVGRGKRRKGDQYRLFLQILRSGELLSTALLPNPGTTVYVHHVLEVRLDQNVSQNEKYLPSVVCFCDIPVQDLPLHMKKYSTFGLAFSKSFLIRQGANPVFYVIRQSPSTLRKTGRSLNRAQLYDRDEPAFRMLCDELASAWPTMKPAAKAGLRGVLEPRQLAALHSFASYEIFSFLKFVDKNLPDDAANNYYMEREWRVIGRVHFSLRDVERVLLPRSYGSRLRADIPEFVGEVTFTA